MDIDNPSKYCQREKQQASQAYEQRRPHGYCIYVVTGVDPPRVYEGDDYVCSSL